MNVLYLGFNSFKGHKRGVENVILFQSMAVDFNTIFYLHWGENTRAYKYDKFLCISVKHCWYWPFILNFVLFKIRKKASVITHSHNSLFSFFSIFPTDILTVHDGLYYQNRSKKRALIFHFLIIEHLLYMRCSLVHFISKYTKEQSEFGARKNFVIIYNTSHLENMVPETQVLNRYDGPVSILAVRSIEERARIDLLLQVAERYSNKDYSFKVAGQGPLLEYYRNEIKLRNITNLQMLGYVSDPELVKLYSTSSLILIIADYGEGFGLPIIEGYLFNKPVASSNRCAIPEVIIHPDFLFENQVESIMEKIEYGLNSSDLNYREYYFERFGNKKILSQIEAMYRRFSK